MNRLEEILLLRKQLQDSYLNKQQELWGSELDLVKKDSKSRKLYNDYRGEDKHLERLQAMEESLGSELEWYKENYLK